MRLHKTLTVLFTLTAMLPILMATMVTVPLNYEHSRDTALDNLRESVNIKATRLQSYFDENKLYLQILSQLPNVEQFASDMQTSTVSASTLKQEQADINHFFKTFVASKPFVENARLLNRDGIIIACNDPEYIGTPALVTSDVLTKAYENGYSFTNIFQSERFKNNKNIHVCFASVINNNEFVGYLAIVNSTRFFENLVLGDAFSSNTKAVIFDENNNIISSTSPYMLETIEQIAKPNTFVEQWRNLKLQDNSSGFLHYTIQKDNRLCYYTTLKDIEWNVLQIINYEDLMLPVYRSVAYIIGFAILIALCCVCVSMWLANKLTKTLQVTLKTMDMIKMGRRDIRLNTKTKSDELNHISQAFNELVNVLQTANHELENKAQFDGLTQLYNRHTFELMARDLMAQYPLESTPKQQAYLVFMFLDIDDFKHFNNDFGHEFGDRVIRFIGETIRQTIDGVGFACRQGGDEFVLCVSDPSTIEHIDEFLKRLTEGLEKGLHVRKNESIQVCCSIGVIMFPQHGTIFEELIQNADAEMYQIKQQGKGAVGIFGEHK